MSRGHFAKHCTLDERVVQRCIGCLLPAMPDPEDPTGKRDLFHGASPWSHSCPNSVVRAVLFYARGAGHLQIVPPPQQPQELLTYIVNNPDDAIREFLRLVGNVC